MAKVKRILLECTNTYETDLNTGVQRVVRNIINESKKLESKFDIKCQPVIIKLGHFYAVEEIIEGKSPKLRIIESLKEMYQDFRLALCRIPFYTKLEKFLFPGPHRLGLTTIIDIIVDILLWPVLATKYSQKKITPEKGDLLLLLDSSWVYPIWRAVRHAKKNGAKVGIVVYDIIQVTHPYLFTPAVVDRFQKWLDHALNNSDFFIGISKNTQDELTKYASLNRPSGNWDGRFESFQLGSVMDKVHHNGRIREKLKNIFDSNNKSNTYLTVGTIEPRKNHKYLLEVFDEVWKKCPDVQLCIVGCMSWLCEEFPKQVQSHPKHKKRLYMFNDLSDTELDYCYKHSKALVYPSLAEGFGLPLVESLYKRLPVLASNIPIFREVGKEFCTYFDANRSQSLADIIIEVEKKGKMPKVRNPEEYELPDWSDSCRELLTKVINLYEKTSA